MSSIKHCKFNSNKPYTHISILFYKWKCRNAVQIISWSKYCLLQVLLLLFKSILVNLTVIISAYILQVLHCKSNSVFFTIRQVRRKITNSDLINENWELIYSMNFRMNYEVQTPVLGEHCRIFIDSYLKTGLFNYNHISQQQTLTKILSIKKLVPTFSIEKKAHNST